MGVSPAGREFSAAQARGDRCIRGFILRSSFVVDSGRAELRIDARLENGETCVIVDRHPTLCFYIKRCDLDLARSLGLDASPIDDWKSMHGEALCRADVTRPREAVAWRDRLHPKGIDTFEADFPFALRYLLDRRIHAVFEVLGKHTKGEGVDRFYHEPELRAVEASCASSPLEWLTVLSIDIETDPKARFLLSFALHGPTVSEVWMLGHAEMSDCLGNVHIVDSRHALLTAFRERIIEIDPDVITGWNVIGFDLAAIDRMAAEQHVSMRIGRAGEEMRIRRREGARRWSAEIPGRVVLDGIDLLRGAGVSMERYGLDHVARKVLGRGKTLSGPSRAEDIQALYVRDPQAFADYNLNDARLVGEIIEKVGVMELAVRRSILTGLPLDRVGASIASFDFLYTEELHRRKIVAPSVRASDRPVGVGGGMVIRPTPGAFRNVLVLDFNSLYPSIIRTFQIDPLGFARAANNGDTITAPSGARFAREQGILTVILDRLFPARDKAKQAGDALTSAAIKTLMNSIYGVLGTRHGRFHHAAIANAVTGFGREILLWSRDHLQALGYDVIYGDTDSLFVVSEEDDRKKAALEGAALAERLNQDLARHVRKRWGVKSRLEVEYERLYLRIFFLHTRHCAQGAMKRYVGLVDDATPEGELRFTGMESVRRDWTDIAKIVQREIYRRFFADEPVDEYLAQVVSEVRAGRHDRRLVYRKVLRKTLGDYSSSPPPHVVAARKMHARRGEVISYIITTEGAEPVDHAGARPDYEHYVQKQIRPVVEPVLEELSLDFDRVVGDDLQHRLF